MRKSLLTALAMMVAVSALVFSSQAENVSLRGEYVEVRTASVFAGACHYNGEVVTTGRDAMMAWNVTSGKWQGVDLTGVRAMAIVNSTSNLSEQNAARHSGSDHRLRRVSRTSASDAECAEREVRLVTRTDCRGS